MWFYTITNEMRERLEGREVDVFAIIYGFSQEGQGCFYGSLAKLSEYCGIKSKTTTQAILKRLIEKGAIVKDEELVKGVKVCSYRVSKNWYTIPKIDMGGMPKIDTNNKDININNTLSNKRSEPFRKPSIEEIRSYCEERRNSVSPERFFNFYESNGWMVGKNRMKDWKAAVRTWENRPEAIRRAAGSKSGESAFERNMRHVDEMFGTNYHEQMYGRRPETDEQ